AAVQIETALPLFFDHYEQDRAMGSFILIDPMSNATVAAGMIEGAAEKEVVLSLETGPTSHSERVRRNGHPPAALWIVGRQGLAERIERIFFGKGWQVHLVSISEFGEQSLRPVAVTLHRLGMVAIFVSPEEGSPLESLVRAIYGEASFLT